jgi:membrane protease YdiL (CAAX protease family)
MQTESGQSRRRRVANVLEIAIVFAIAWAIIGIGWVLVGGDAFARQAVVWVANVAMLITIRIGLGRRGQTFADFGLAVRWPGWKTLVIRVLQAMMLLVAALAAFVAGQALFSGAAQPAAADMSGYTYLQDNLPLFILALVGVWIVSSFGEEVVYRGFLMHRVAELDEGSTRGWILATAVSAAVFGLAHFSWGLVGIVQTTLMGLVLSVSYIALRRNLWVLVLAHVLMDTLLLVQLYGASPQATGP